MSVYARVCLYGCAPRSSERGKELRCVVVVVCSKSDILSAYNLSWTVSEMATSAVSACTRACVTH